MTKQGLKPLPIPASSRWDEKAVTVEFYKTPDTGDTPMPNRNAIKLKGAELE